MRFLDFLFPPRDDELLTRELTVDTLLPFLTPHVVTRTRPETITLLPFHKAEVRSLLHEAKYHGSEHAFTLLAAVLTDFLHDSEDLTRAKPEKIQLVPVPLSRERFAKRGYNQVEEVAKRSNKKLEYTVDSTLLIRLRDTPTQVSLAREKREENMRGAFSARHLADPALTYILIDDVITTGATLQAAIEALKAAGAVNIIPLALAH